MSGLRAWGWLRDHHADVSLFLHGVAHEAIYGVSRVRGHVTDAAGIDPRVLALDPSVLVLRLDSLLVVAELVVGDQQGEFVGFGGVLVLLLLCTELGSGQGDAQKAQEKNDLRGKQGNEMLFIFLSQKQEWRSNSQRDT